MRDAITDADLRRGIAAWSNRLHVPVTRMMSRTLREEIYAARERRVREEHPYRRLRDNVLAGLAWVCLCGFTLSTIGHYAGWWP